MTLLQSSFPINLNSFYVKIGEPLTKTSKLLTFSRPFSNLKCFPWNSFESKDSICCTNAKIKFYFFRGPYEISEMKQKSSPGSNYTFKDGLAEYYTVFTQINAY